jgi:hypothetical protein
MTVKRHGSCLSRQGEPSRTVQDLIVQIANVTCRAFRLPLKQSFVSSRVTMTHRELVTVPINLPNDPNRAIWVADAS